MNSRRRRMKRIIPVLVMLVGSAVSFSQSDPIVTVTGGQIRGRLVGVGGAVFKGIPYAQPPVGNLRWREPTPVKPWTGVRDATDFGSICAQPPLFVPNAADISKEDCLY